MNCATHNDTAAVAFCRSCGKPLCAACTRDVRGVVYCEPCLAARLEGVPAPPPTVYQQVMDQGLGMKVPPLRPSHGPNPTVAGILAGFFPFGVGAVYCSQYAKGLAHLLIFGLLIFGVDHAGSLDFVFGIGIAFFYVYQIIDAVRTARALQEGQAPPDPFGLGQAFSFGDKGESKNIPFVAILLIGLGVLFLLHTMNIFEFGLDRFWPLILIVLGGWMFARQFGSGALAGARAVTVIAAACARSWGRRCSSPSACCFYYRVLMWSALTAHGPRFCSWLASLNSCRAMLPLQDTLIRVPRSSRLGSGSGSAASFRPRRSSFRGGAQCLARFPLQFHRCKLPFHRAAHADRFQDRSC